MKRFLIICIISEAFLLALLLIACGYPTVPPTDTPAPTTRPPTTAPFASVLIHPGSPHPDPETLEFIGVTFESTVDHNLIERLSTTDLVNLNASQENVIHLVNGLPVRDMNNTRFNLPPVIRFNIDVKLKLSAGQVMIGQFRVKSGKNFLLPIAILTLVSTSSPQTAKGMMYDNPKLETIQG